MLSLVLKCCAFARRLKTQINLLKINFCLISLQLQIVIKAINQTLWCQCHISSEKLAEYHVMSRYSLCLHITSWSDHRQRTRNYFYLFAVKTRETKKKSSGRRSCCVVNLIYNIDCLFNSQSVINSVSLTYRTTNFSLLSLHLCFGSLNIFRVKITLRCFWKLNIKITAQHITF